MPFECMGEIEAGLFEWWLGLYPPLLIAIHFANIALNHMNLTSPSSCVIYFHWLSWIVLAIPFPWSLQWVGSYKVVAQFDRFLLGLSCKVQLGDILLQLHERNEIKVEQRLQEATMEVQYFSMVVTSCIFLFSFDFKFQYFEYYTMRMRSVANWANISSFWCFQRKSVAGCTVGVSCSSWLLHTSLPALAAQGCLIS